MLSPASSSSSGSEPPRRIALVDCNNFYVSCERVFNAHLVGKPVIVLSNNDGCAIARSAEAKALGIKMGDPWHQMQQLAKQHGIVARSSNYVLYGDMSARVVAILRTFAADVEVYSIDESFLDLGNLPIPDLKAHGRAIVQRVQQWVGMPVCVGIGPTKTLAKLANHVAKKTPRLASVCDFGRLSPDQLLKVLDRIEVGDVWGVGRRLSVRLGVDGIKTAGDLARADSEQIKRQYNVVLERTVRELRGISCVDLEMAPPPKQQIMCSRSFGTPMEAYADVAEALTAHTNRAAVKLRDEGSTAGAVHVLLHTNPHRTDLPQHNGAMTVPLTRATADTSRLLEAAHYGLRRIWRDGYRFIKVGVMLMELAPASQVQADLFGDHTAHDARRLRLMAAMDQINRVHGREAVRVGLVSGRRVWSMRQELKSPSYTTRWAELLEVKA